jgi:hypothetical protein
MTRRDYELLHAAISRVRGLTPDAVNMRREVAESIADALAQANPRFERDRFLRDCGVKS